MKAALPSDEANRLASLRGLGLLDTPAEERFDRITRMAQRLFDVPIALVSLVDEDRQWFKSHQGLDATETPREMAFCAHALGSPEVLHVSNATTDPRFSDNPLVQGDPNIRFYAGAPIAGPDGAPLGTLCVIDREPRDLSPDDLQALQDLATMVEHEIAFTELAITDELTGLSNRRGMHLLGVQAIDVCARLSLPAVLVFVDLDNLKPINDGFGHEVGDRAIRVVADAMASSFRSAGVIARVGGDELCALLVATESHDEPIRRLEQAVAKAAEGDAGLRQLAVSVGLARFDPAEPVGLDDLIAEADAAMYAAKQSKSGRAARQVR